MYSDVNGDRNFIKKKLYYSLFETIRFVNMFISPIIDQQDGQSNSFTPSVAATGLIVHTKHLRHAALWVAYISIKPINKKLQVRHLPPQT